MSYMATSGVVIVKTNLKEEDFNKLKKVHFEKDNVGYGIDISENDIGVLWWMNNFKYRFQVNLKQEAVEFFRKESTFVFLISSKTFLSRLKVVLEKIFGKEFEVEIMKHPLISNMEELKESIEDFTKECLSVEKVFVETSDYIGVTLGFKKNEKQYLVKYFSDGTISFGLGKGKADIEFIVDFVVKLNDYIVKLDLKRS